MCKLVKNNKEISQISLLEWQWRQCWDEEGRIRSSLRADDRGEWAAWYGYDDGGERAVKLSGECVTITQNGHTTRVASLTNPVVYTSPLVTLTKRGYTKHYFEGERRICSAIGGGFTHVEWDSIDASQDKVVAPICDDLFPLLDDAVEEAMHCVEVNDMDITVGIIHRMLRTEATKPHDDPEQVYYYHNERCRSREQRKLACYAETRQRVRSQHLGGTALRYDGTQAETEQGSGDFPCFGSEVHRTSSSYGEDWVDVIVFLLPKILEDYK